MISGCVIHTGPSQIVVSKPDSTVTYMNDAFPGRPVLNMQTWVCLLSHFSHVQLFVTLWTVAYQAPKSMGFSRQEYWSGLPHPPPGDLPDPGMEPISQYVSCIRQAGSLPVAPPRKQRCIWDQFPHLPNSSFWYLYSSFKVFNVRNIVL